MMWHQLRDPLKLAAFLWPEAVFYDKQREIIQSVETDDETYVVAGNQLGKDYVAAFIVLSFFLRHHPVKIVTTSATSRHLTTLWGEMDRLIRTSRYPLTVENGGPLVYNHMELKKRINGVVEKDTFVVGTVASSENRGEGMAGHHQAHTLFVSDEASGTPDVAYKMAQGWAKRMLIFGNPNPCSNFFRRGVKAGNLLKVA